MFLDIITKRKEQVLINLDQVLYITPNRKGGTVIVDVTGVDYEIKESYEEVKTALSKIAVVSFPSDN